MTEQKPIVLVGAGLAGLTCARELNRHGRRVLLFEASGTVGGRVRTEVVDGFRCDRGFQVFLDSYPEAKRQLDYDALELRPMSSGSLVFDGQTLHRFADPWREPRHAWASIKSPVGSLVDKLRIAAFRREAQQNSRRPLEQIADIPARDELRSRGFSETVIERFFRPFLGGIFLDPQLETSARLLHFVFGMFANGRATLPADGMQAIPEQLAAGLPDGCVRLNSPVETICANRVTLSDGTTVDADHVIVATDEFSASRLLPKLPSPSSWRSTTTLYFTAARDPIDEPTLVLNGSGRGRVNSVVNLAAAAPSYSPNGQPLLSVSILTECPESDDELANIVRQELVAYFGEETLDWTLLKRDTIRHALPDQSAGSARPLGNLVMDGVTVCGDWRTFGSIHHAMISGREAATSVLGR